MSNWRETLWGDRHIEITKDTRAVIKGYLEGAGVPFVDTAACPGMHPARIEREVVRRLAERVGL